MNQLTVEVVRVLDTTVSGANDFKSRKLHGKTIEQYPQTLEIEFTQGNVSLLNDLVPGQKMRIDINLKGREWTNQEGKISVFNKLEGWKTEKLA
jgi:translation initiation factor IF-3